MQIQHIFVIGAGTMGSGIAQVAATSGYSVALMDVIPEQLERARATIARSVGASLSPAISGFFLANPVLFGAPFLVAGSLKIVYDLLLYHSFRTLKPPEEKVDTREANATLPK